MSKKNELISFCLIILLAAGLRFSGICFDSLWLDESYQSLTGASGQGAPDLTFSPGQKFLFRFGPPASPEKMLSNFRSVDPLCPPLYALLLNRWISALGDSDFCLRSLSAIISTMSVAFLMIFARIFLGPRAAFWAGLLNAVSPFDIHYAQEARMYSLVSLNAVLSSSSLILALKSDLKTPKSLLLLPLYAISTWALINSHYTALFLAASQGLAATLFLMSTGSWRRLALIALAWLGTFIMWIPWLPMFFQSALSRKENFYVARVPDLIWPLKALFIRIPVNWLVFLSGQRVTAFAGGIYASSLAMLTASAVSWRTEDQQKTLVLKALWVWALLPALGLWTVDLLENHRVIEVSRYVIFTAPAIYMLAGRGVEALLAYRQILKLVIIFHLIFSLANLFYTHTVKQREPWREMARKVEALVPPGEVLVVSQYYDIACLDRYLTRPRLQLGLSPAMGKDTVQQKLALLNSFALITAQEGESIKDMLSPAFKMKQQIDMPHGLHLRIYCR